MDCGMVIRSKLDEFAQKLSGSNGCDDIVAAIDRLINELRGSGIEHKDLISEVERNGRLPEEYKHAIEAAIYLGQFTQQLAGCEDIVATISQREEINEEEIFFNR
jgi:hypothetical protein